MGHTHPHLLSLPATQGGTRQMQLCPTSGKTYPLKMKVEDSLLENTLREPSALLCRRNYKDLPGRTPRAATLCPLPGSYAPIIALF